MMKIIYSLLFIILLISCKENNVQDVSEQNLDTIATAVVEEEPHFINYDKVKVLKTVFVTDINGLEMKQSTTSASKTLGNLIYGSKLEVIEDAGEWLGIRERISREYEEEGRKIESNAWEKIYVLRKSTGSIHDIKLLPSHLNVISSLSQPNGETKFYEKGTLLQNYLKVELISEAIYKRQKETAVNFLIHDTLNIKKVSGVTELPCENNMVTFVDKPNDEDTRCEFTYIGQIPELNKYVIAGSYWESGDIIFVDKNSGKKSEILDYPYLSQNKKFLICIYANPYDTTADLEFYGIENKNLKLIAAISFKDWMPVTYEFDKEKPDNMFWGNDNCFYLKALHSQAYWQENGMLNNKGQYLKIKIL